MEENAVVIGTERSVVPSHQALLVATEVGVWEFQLLLKN